MGFVAANWFHFLTFNSYQVYTLSYIFLNKCFQNSYYSTPLIMFTPYVIQTISIFVFIEKETYTMEFSVCVKVAGCSEWLDLDKYSAFVAKLFSHLFLSSCL